MEIGGLSTILNNRLTTIVEYDTFISNKELYNNPNVAVIIDGDDGNKYALPCRSKTDVQPGIYDEGLLYFYKLPEDSEKDLYDIEKLNIINHNDATSISDYISKRKQLRQLESDLITDIDNLFTPPIDQDDQPEMVAIKKAITSKHIDIGKYEHRFGNNFLNTKSLFKRNSITLNKLTYIADNLDMDIILTIQNKSDDVINPMKNPITVKLTGEDVNYE